MRRMVRKHRGVRVSEKEERECFAESEEMKIALGDSNLNSRLIDSMAKYTEVVDLAAIKCQIKT